jgi:putative nucleotidyltransferase with HDIG domain
MSVSWAQLLDRIETLPSLPAVLLEVMDLLGDPRVPVGRVAAALRQDPALTADLLRLVNSSFFGLSRQITTVTEAVGLLGTEAIRQLCLTAAVFRLLPTATTPGFSPALLCAHSLATGVAASLLAHRAGRAETEALFVAGLLHDVGKLVELHALPAEFTTALAVARDHDVPLHTAEQWCWGFTHAEVGRMLAERWRFPAPLGTIIAGHHDPAQAVDAPWETVVVHVANSLAHALHLGESGNDDAVPPLAPGAWVVLGLGETDLESLLADLDEQVRRVLADATK